MFAELPRFATERVYTVNTGRRAGTGDLRLLADEMRVSWLSRVASPVAGGAP